jgi:hypothetical protein
LVANYLELKEQAENPAEVAMRDQESPKRFDIKRKIALWPDGRGPGSPARGPRGHSP